MISWVASAGYFLLTVITLGIMLVYLVNLKETPRPASFWVTIIGGLWMIYNLVYDFAKIKKEG
jgi:hypothetical protein